jgi:hypothetical protein
MGWDVCYCRKRTSKIVFTSAAGPLYSKGPERDAHKQNPKAFLDFHQKSNLDLLVR